MINSSSWNQVGMAETIKSSQKQYQKNL